MKTSVERKEMAGEENKDRLDKPRVDATVR